MSSSFFGAETTGEMKQPQKFGSKQFTTSFAFSRTTITVYLLNFRFQWHLTYILYLNINVVKFFLFLSFTCRSRLFKLETLVVSFAVFPLSFWLQFYFLMKNINFQKKDFSERDEKNISYWKVILLIQVINLIYTSFNKAYCMIV